MKKIFILAIATVVFASCNKYNNSSNEVISNNYAYSGRYPFTNSGDIRSVRW